MLTRWRVPGPLAALAMMTLLASLLCGLVYGLAGPATDWFNKLPQSLPRIEEHLSLLREPAQRMLRLLDQLGQVTGGGRAAAAPAIQGSTLAAYLFSGTRSILTGFFLTALLLFFLLSAGDIFMRKLVEILPSFGDKKRAVEMSREIEQEISAYLVTITIMNTLVGLATFGAMWALGLANPLLWGAVAFILNYVLILGPLTGLVIFFAVGPSDISDIAARAVAAGSLSRDPPDRGRDRDANAGGAPLHAQSGAGDRLAHLLELDVGHSGRASCRAAPRHHQDRVRARAAVGADRPFPRRLRSGRLGSPWKR